MAVLFEFSSDSAKSLYCRKQWLKSFRYQIVSFLIRCRSRIKDCFSFYVCVLHELVSCIPELTVTKQISYLYSENVGYVPGLLREQKELTAKTLCHEHEALEIIAEG